MELTQLPLLAPPADLADRRGIAVDEDPQTLSFLAEASTFFRSYTGLDITYVEDDEQVLHGTWDDILKLPQLPIRDIASVDLRYPGEDLGTDMQDDYTASKNRLYRYGGWGGPDAAVTVVYSHGFDVVPDDVRRCVVSLAARLAANPTDAIGERIGSYEVQYAQQNMLDSSPVGLSVREIFVLDKYAAWARL